MRAVLGDQIVVDGTRRQTPSGGVPSGVVRRDGEVLALPHPDGSPPFEVRWSDDGRTSVSFPGPDAHVVHFAHSAGIEGNGGGSHVRKR